MEKCVSEHWVRLKLNLNQSRVTGTGVCGGKRGGQGRKKVWGREVWGLGWLCVWGAGGGGTGTVGKRERVSGKHYEGGGVRNERRNSSVKHHRGNQRE